MGMKPVTPPEHGGPANVCTSSKSTSHYAQVANTNTSNKPTENPQPANSGAGTTTKGTVPKAL
jgi:hypothetical protein